MKLQDLKRFAVATSMTTALGMSLLVAVPQSYADDHSRCQRDIERREMKLDEAIRKHGERSHQADQRRRDLRQGDRRSRSRLPRRRRPRLGRKRQRREQDDERRQEAHGDISVAGRRSASQIRLEKVVDAMPRVSQNVLACEVMKLAGINHEGDQIAFVLL